MACFTTWTILCVHDLCNLDNKIQVPVCSIQGKSLRALVGQTLVPFLLYLFEFCCTHLLVGHSVVPPKEARSNKVCNHHIHSVVVMCQKDAENPHSTQNQAKPVVPPEPLGGICQSNRAELIHHKSNPTVSTPEKRMNSLRHLNGPKQKIWLSLLCFSPLDVTAISIKFVSTSLVQKQCNAI